MATVVGAKEIKKLGQQWMPLAKEMFRVRLWARVPQFRNPDIDFYMASLYGMEIDMRKSEMESVYTSARQFHWWDIPNTVPVQLVGYS
jgi:hypothetical protein